MRRRVLTRPALMRQVLMRPLGLKKLLDLMRWDLKKLALPRRQAQRDPPKTVWQTMEPQKIQQGQKNWGSNLVRNSTQLVMQMSLGSSKGSSCSQEPRRPAQKNLLEPMMLPKRDKGGTLELMRTRAGNWNSKAHLIQGQKKVLTKVLMTLVLQMKREDSLSNKAHLILDRTMALMTPLVGSLGSIRLTPAQKWVRRLQVLLTNTECSWNNMEHLTLDLMTVQTMQQEPKRWHRTITLAGS
jgi:hypothetical protein